MRTQREITRAIDHLKEAAEGDGGEVIHLSTANSVLIQALEWALGHESRFEELIKHLDAAGEPRKPSLKKGERVEVSANAARFFWPCGCTGEDWQKKFGTQQPRCGMCLSVEAFFKLGRVEQAEAVLELFRARMGMSSWLAANDADREMVEIPRDIAKRAAGWQDSPELTKIRGIVRSATPQRTETPPDEPGAVN